MGKSAPSPPPAPDPTIVAQAQTTSNLATAQAQSQLNNVNQSTPYGSVTYTQPGGADTPYTENVQLSPQEQAVFNATTANQAQAAQIAGADLPNVASALATPVNAQPTVGNVAAGSLVNQYSQGPPIETGYNYGGSIQGQVNAPSQSDAIQQAQNAAYQAQAQYLNPQWQQNAEQEQAGLVAQGLNPNDAAYQNAMTLFGNQENQAYGNAGLQAVQAGDTEQNTLQSQALQSGEFANAAQAQANSENAGQAGFYDTAAGQYDAQNASEAGFQNTTQNQQFTQGATNAQLANAAAQQAFQQQAYAQELPINEYSALESGSQVQAPTSTPAQTAVAPTDVTGAYALQQQALQQAYQSQMANYQSGLGGLFNLGAAAMALA